MIVLLLLDIAIIVATGRLVGSLFRRLGQPQVIGEMVGGLLLGPSFLGWIAPDLAAALFPQATTSMLAVLTQISLLLFMFLVGLDFNPAQIRGIGHAAVLTSHVSIAVPFLLGVTLSLFLYPRLADEHVSFAHFALFMGAAMSVTAFPVLARILEERRLARTRLGTISVACAAVDDVSAWCILAYIVGAVRLADDLWRVGLTLAGLAVFALVMIGVVRPWLRRVGPGLTRDGHAADNMFAVVLTVVLCAAAATEWLGIHVVFGAFLAGAIMPKDEAVRAALNGRMRALVLVLLLPLFFAFTGLRTELRLVWHPDAWLYTVLILVVAIAGKMGGTIAASRVAGLSWREALALGTLMNTRGLMELVVLNIGLELGVISPTVFAMMVLMAVITTVMTWPLLRAIYPTGLERSYVGGAASGVPSSVRI